MTARRGPYGTALGLAALTVGLSVLARLSARDPGGGPALRVVFTGETDGFLEPCGCNEGQLGGLARRDSWVWRLRREGRPLLLVDNGDLAGDPVREGGRLSELKRATTMRAMALMGYDVVNLGERDLELGPEALDPARPAGAPVLVACNLRREDGTTVGDAVRLQVRLAGREVEVAIVGLLGADFDLVARGVGLVLEPPGETLARLAPGLEGASAAVLLYHGEAAEAERLAAAHPWLDLVVAGHGREQALVRPALAVPPVKGRYLGVADLPLGGPGAARVRFDPLDAFVDDSPRILRLLEDHQRRLLAEGVLDTSPRVEVVGGGHYLGSEACRGCHGAAHEAWGRSRHRDALEDLRRYRGGRHGDPGCVRCHVTGFGTLTGYRDEAITGHLSGVGCESCHGVGSRHAAEPLRRGYGRTAGEALCRGCHDPENDPLFDHDAAWRRIAHGL
ncbi:MAG: hypothetical protein HY722_12240 [Planctomycetes bacterium]|nr:hypothetical protein [Planctomycetota bacterium]